MFFMVINETNIIYKNILELFLHVQTTFFIFVFQWFDGLEDVVLLDQNAKVHKFHYLLVMCH